MRMKNVRKNTKRKDSKRSSDSRMRHEKNLGYLASFPEMNPNPVVEVNADGSIEYLNPAAKKLFPDLQDMGQRHAWLVDLESISILLKDQKKNFYIREVKVDGNWYHQSFHLIPGLDHIRIYSLDITERKRMEDELKQAHDLLEAVTKGTEVIVATLDANFRYTFFNRAYEEEVKRLTRKEIQIGSSMLEVFSHLPEQLEAAREQWSRTLNGESRDYQIEFGDPDWHRRFYSVRQTPIRDADGIVIGAGEVAYDVTEQVRAQQALKQSELKFRILADNTYDMEFWINPESHYVFVSPSCKRITGHDPNDFIENPGLRRNLVHPEDLPIFDRHRKEEEEEEVTPREVQYRIICPDGSIRWIGHVCQRIFDEEGRFLGIRASNRDITDRKKVEETLEAARVEVLNEKNRLEALMEALPIGVALTDAQGGNIRANKAFEQVWGTPRPVASVADYAAYKAWWPETDKPVAPEEWASAQAVQKGQAVVGQLLEIQRFDGSRASVINSGAPIFDAAGKIDGCAVAIQDITEMRNAERALRNSEERLRLMIETSPVAIGFGDSTGKIFEANESFYRLTGYTRKEIEANELGWNQLTAPEYAELDRQTMATLAATGTAGPYEKEYIRKDGSRVPLLLSVSKLPGRDEHIAFIVDITDRKQMEEELRRSRDELEIRVQERTAELTSVVAELQDEMAEHRQAEEALRKANFDLNERIKEINCLYSISYYVEKQYLLLEEKLKNIVDLIPSGWQYPEITCARIILEGKEYKTDNFKETPWKQSSDIIAHDKKMGTIEVFYLEKKPEAYEEPFLKEERGLINAIAVELGEMIAHMQAEKALVEQSRILEAFFTSTITPLVFLDKDFNFVRVNEAYAKVCQRDISEFPGHNHFEFYPSDAKSIFQRVVETKTAYQALARPFTFPDHPQWGVTYWNWILTPILDSRGEVEFLVFALQDVTERKHAEEAVKAERQRFNDVLEMLPAYVILLTPDYHVPFANRIFRERFGESDGRRCFEYLFGRTEPCETCETYTVLKTAAPHHWEWTGPDGRNYDIFDFPFTDTDGSPLVLEMGIDITERKKAEEALRAAQQYNRSLIEASLDPLVTISTDGKIMDVNRATELVSGVPRDDLIGSDFSDYFTEPEKAREGYKRVFQTGLVFDYPLAIRDSSGRITEVLYNAALYKNEAGEAQGVFAAARDITELKRTQDALRAVSLYTRSLIEASLDPLVTISPAGKIMDVNSATELNTGVPRDELIGTDFSDYFTEPEKAREGYQRVFQEGFVRDYPLAIRHTSGKVTDVLYHATVFRNEAGEIQGVFAAARDITVRRELQRRIEATNALLNLFVKMPSRKEYLDAALELIQNWSGCRCAGIRVLNEKDYIPYESYKGFSSQFWKSENLLSVKYDQCACIRVVTGNPDPQDHPRMTPAGSFWCDNTFEFFGNLSEEEKARFRGACVQNGFKSVAVIPIRYREEILGAIHLADEKEGIVPLSSIEFIESMGPLIGEAINRFNLEEEIKESESRLRHLSAELLTVQENERRRISREIHDGLGQTLTAIKFSLESKLSQMGKRKVPPGITLENIISLAGSGIEEARRIQMDLRPSILDDLGILATIGWFTREFQKVYAHISVKKQISVEEDEIPDSLRTVLFRVMQEAMNNIAKHSKADLIHISLKRLGDNIELMIEDNGVGFQPESIKKGLGLTSMRERTELSRGSLTIESTPGKGTTIKAQWTI